MAGAPYRFNACMLWAASCMCFFFFILYTGEVVVPSNAEYNKNTHLSIDDILVDNVSSPRWLEIRIKASKTDPFRKGVSIFIRITGNNICPVATIIDYRVRRGSHPGPFFYFSDGRFPTSSICDSPEGGTCSSRGRSNKVLWSQLQNWCCHNCIIIWYLRFLDKDTWSWESTAYTLYIRIPQETLCEVSQKLATQVQDNPVIHCQY